MYTLLLLSSSLIVNVGSLKSFQSKAFSNNFKPLNLSSLNNQGGSNLTPSPLQSNIDESRVSFTLAKIVGTNSMSSFVTRESKSFYFTGPSSQQFLMKFATTPKRIYMLAKPELDVLLSLRHAVHYICNKSITVYLDNDILNYLSGDFLDNYNTYPQTSDISCPLPSSLLPENEDSEACETHLSITQLIRNGRIQLMCNGSLPLIDLIVTFGGDGLLMHCNTLYETHGIDINLNEDKSYIPPTMAFDFGSLGFLAPFQYEDFEKEVRIMTFVLLLAAMRV